jgi:hypothetical protein
MQIAALGIQPPALPFPAGKKRTGASKGEPQLNMMRENTDGLCKIALCNLPFWMVLLNVNLFAGWVNCFFRVSFEFAALGIDPNDHWINYFE